YDGGEVINSKTGENALADNYPLQSNEVVRAYASNGSNESGLYFVVGISGRNLGEQDVELRLYQYGKQSLTPDAVLTLTQEEGYDITEAHVGELDLGLRYQGELWMNGKPVGVDSNYSYVNARESVFNWDKVSYTATAEP